jgi:hypothetical protein
MALLDDLSFLTWLEPWVALQPSETRQHEQALLKCLMAEHPLHGRSVRALAARSDDAEDVLFLMGEPDALCVVNLGSAGKPSATRPFFVIYTQVSEFEQGCMLPDHLEYTDEDV